MHISAFCSDFDNCFSAMDCGKSNRGIPSEEIGTQILQRSGVRLIAFDPEREELVQRK